MRSRNISEEVRSVLEKLDALTPITFADICQQIGANTLEERRSVRTALQRHEIAHIVATNSRTAKYYAIRLELMRSMPDTEIYLSLPGIESDLIGYDSQGNREIDIIIDQFKKLYGEEVVQFWIRPAQFRSVDLISPSAKKGGDCKLCTISRYYDFPLPENPGRIRASHIISRRTVFWKTLNEIQANDPDMSIFSQDAVKALKTRLKADPYHSDERFILPLCEYHDAILLDSLQAKHKRWAGAEAEATD